MIAFASNDATPRHRITKRHRASDPATPLPELAEVAALYPEEVHANPAFQLTLLADPAAILQFPHNSIHALIKCRSAPRSLLSWCADRHKEMHPFVPRARWLIAQHPNADAAVLAKLSGTPEEFICSMHVASPGAFQTDWCEELLDAVRVWRTAPLRAGDLRVVGGLLRHGLVDGTDRLVLAAIAVCGPSACLRFLGEQTGLPDAVAAPLFDAAVHAVEQTMGARIHQRRSQAPGGGRRLERSEFCGAIESHEDAVLLASSRMAANRMRACMALGGRLPPEILASLAADRTWRVRAAVAYRPQLGLDLSLRLASDPELAVREVLAGATHHPEVLVRLARDPSIRVRYRAAGNHACTPVIDQSLRNSALIRDCLMDAWRSGQGTDAEGKPLARRDQSDRWTAEECAILALRSPADSLARLLLMASERCPVEVLEHYAGNSCWWLRIAVARNRRTPEARVRHAATTDSNWLVRSAASEALAAREAAAARGMAAVPLPEPFRAEAISERHVAASMAKTPGWVRAMMSDVDWHRVQTAILASLAIEPLRGFLLAGMLRGRSRMRGSALSLIRQRVQPQWTRLAEDFLAEQLCGKASPEREEAVVMAGCEDGVVE